MLTEKDYCDYETCVALKELGYNGTTGECSHFGAFYMNGTEIFYDRLYNSELKENECLRVPLYLAQKWLREEYGLIVMVVFSASTQTWSFWEQRKEDGHVYRQGDLYLSYEEALLECIKGAVKILKDGQAN